MVNVGIFYGHFICIGSLHMFIWYILRSFGTVRNGGSLKRAFIFTNKEVTEHSNRRSDTD
jgi:hypothetical protein